MKYWQLQSKARTNAVRNLQIYQVKTADVSQFEFDPSGDFVNAITFQHLMQCLKERPFRGVR